ncbi:MAG: hydroxyacid dehydrogenase [Lachnospiraceae bacterium]|nr:hydroxyacid dehydrogenase [Lachnospiraceae bacterium]
MKISLLEPIGLTFDEIEELAKEIRSLGAEFTYYDTKTTDPAELIRRSEGQDAVMIANNPYPDEVVRALPDLKMIAVAFTGIDHVGLEACREKGIMVLNCAGYSTVSVAEEVIGLTLAVYRKLLEGDSAVRGGKTSAGLTGLEIAGKTVGILGCGTIGIQTGKLFKAFGAEVLAYARHERPEWKEEGFIPASVEEILEKCDIISINMPNNASTKGFFGREQINAMKPGSILINCARGPIVDNEALAEALNAGRIAGAGIDVFDMEPPIPADYPLVSAKNTVLMPHVGFLTKEAMVRRGIIEFSNVASWIKGSPENVCSF